MVTAPVMTPAGDQPVAITDEHRTRLWRAFQAWTGNGALADDLTQEALVEAWRSARRPTAEPDLTRWLYGVARNVLRRYRRRQGGDRSVPLERPDHGGPLALASQSLDLDAELEREEIMALLDAALARLPADSRRAVLMRYIDDLPQREIAARLGIHEKALEGRLHRGKRALHRYLVTDGQDVARALGLLTSGNQWQVTNLWCDGCGVQRLVGRWLADGGLVLDCPSCSLLGGRRACHTNVDGTFTAGLRSFGAATRRIAGELHRETRHGIADPDPCPGCGGAVETIRPATDTPSLFEFRLRCRACGDVRYRSSAGVTGCHPSFGRWLKRERRVAFDPSTAVIERGGREAVRLRWTSRTSAGTWEAVRDRETLAYHLIAIDGRPVPIADAGEWEKPLEASGSTRQVACDGRDQHP